MTTTPRCEFCDSSLHITPKCPSRQPVLSPFAKRREARQLPVSELNRGPRL